MRVLIFSLTFRPFIGGAEVAVEETMKRLSNVDATVITARLKKELPEVETIDRIKVYRVGIGVFSIDKYLFPYFSYKKAIELHTKEKFDLVVAIMAFYAGLASVLFKKRFPSVPYLLNMQSGDSEWFVKIRTWWFYPLYKKVYTKADRIYAISNYLISRAKRYGYKGKAVRIPNGVDYEYFSKEITDSEKNTVREELGIEEDEIVVITTSRLVYKNGIDQLILGFNEWVIKSEKKGKLIILGEGKLLKRIKKLVSTLNIENKVIFTGFKDNAELPKYLHTADIFCRPSRSEGMGISFVEAMAAGIPIIATRTGGISDFLENEKTGIVVTKDNPDSIARAIHELSTQPELYQRIVSNSKELVQKEYEWDVIAQDIYSLYQEVL